MADRLRYLDDNNFEKEIADGITLVDFYAEWCGPCRMMEPIIEELASGNEFEGKVQFVKIDIETSPKVTANSNVTSVPTLILFKSGQEALRIVGVKDKDSLLDAISKAIA